MKRSSTLKALLALLVVILSSHHTRAQESMMIKKRFTHELGVVFGEVTNVGFSYRLGYSRFKFQPAFSYRKNEYSVDYYLGTGLYFRVAEHEKSRLYVFHSYLLQQRVFRNAEIPRPKEFRDLVRASGFGFAFEFLIKKRVGINIMLGKKYSEKFRTIISTGAAGIWVRIGKLDTGSKVE